jgi:hypothetical protein
MRVHRSLALSIALGVTTALLAACSDGGPTSPDPAQAGPSFAQKQIWFHDNADWGSCSKWGSGWFEVGWWNFTTELQAAALKADRNEDGLVCYKWRT